MIIILSLYLDGLIASLNIDYLVPLLTLTSIIFIKNNISDIKYYSLSFLIGLIYDLLFTNVLLFHSIIFLNISFIVKHIKIKDNLLNDIILTISVIIIYRIIMFLLYLLLSINMNLLSSIYNSLIINILFVIIICPLKKMNKNKI